MSRGGARPQESLGADVGAPAPRPTSRRLARDLAILLPARVHQAHHLGLVVARERLALRPTHTVSAFHLLSTKPDQAQSEDDQLRAEQNRRTWRR